LHLPIVWSFLGTDSLYLCASYNIEEEYPVTPWDPFQLSRESRCSDRPSTKRLPAIIDLPPPPATSLPTTLVPDQQLLSCSRIQLVILLYLQRIIQPLIHFDYYLALAN